MDSTLYLNGAHLLTHPYGYTTFSVDITDRLRGMDVRVTRLAHGVPVGGELDYLDEGTLTQALKARTSF